MRINTITCHDVYNYGASLQAYALQQYLESQGHYVEIINYLPPYIKHVPKFWEIRANSKYRSLIKYNPILRLFYSLIILYRYHKWKNRRNAFNEFTQNYLRLTRKYTNIQELRSDPPQGECYIVGSDQVWNSYLNNGKDDAFFLAFGDTSKRRIAYACSFGNSNIAPGYKNFTIEKLKHFDAISVREASGVKIITELGFNATQVLDPVFLLEKKDWEKIATSSCMQIKEKYILVYQIYMNNPLMKNWCKKLKKETNYKIIAIETTFSVDFADAHIRNAGPIEFLELIQKASYVISDSFHATAFSSIFNTPFIITINTKITNTSRLIDFCNNIECSFLYNPPVDSILYKSINWNKINELLKHYAINSKSFLKNNITTK